ncbi:MAG: hypothetical protein NZ700_10665 [Gemmataceae bacterium]|nr:hypothetical protein [Gemmataceae bacterium]MDW8264451.1 hypothetical protein [Gemmataceae bacterium]
MNTVEYLVSLGAAGRLGRCRAASAHSYGRGDRVIVRTAWGLEVGTVLGLATDRHAQWLPKTDTADLLRLITLEDEGTVQARRELGNHIFDDATEHIRRSGLPLALLDVDITFDASHALVYHVSWEPFDPRRLVEPLSTRWGVSLALHDLAAASESGCGRPGCGQGGGGCTSCQKGGCATGCGSAAQARQVHDYLAHLRPPRETAGRVPLL